MSATRYKVGDVVLVNKKLLSDYKYGGVYVANEMLVFRGKTITIDRVIKSESFFETNDYTGHYISEGWNWTDQMLEDYMPIADNDTDSRINNEGFPVKITAKELSDLYK